MGWWIPALKREHLAAIAARLGQLPEAERRGRLARASGQAGRDRRVRVLGPVGLAMFAVAAITSYQWPGRPSPPQVLFGLTSLTITGVAMAHAVITHYRLTRHHLAAQFPTLCPACGYDRRATLARCPECGTETPAAP